MHSGRSHWIDSTSLELLKLCENGAAKPEISGLSVAVISSVDPIMGEVDR